MRLAIDIDSTLHHYWDRLSDAARRRFGIELPYDEQFEWGITRLRPEQLEVCFAETHTDAAIVGSEPYPLSVETVNRWHADGHYVHITSHRPAGCQTSTAAWLDRIGLSHDDLYCSTDKVTRCVALEIDLLIDDSPENIRRALDRGITVATLIHPWNEEIVETEDVIGAHDWVELAAKLDPILAGESRLASVDAA